MLIIQETLYELEYYKLILYRFHSTNPSYCDMPKFLVGKYKTAKHT